MTLHRLLELVALQLLDNYLETFSKEDFDKFCEKYDIISIRNRSYELVDEFLSPYVIDKGVTAK